MVKLGPLFGGTAQQSGQVELDVIAGGPFGAGKDAPVQLLLPVHYPGHHGVTHKLNGLLGDVREGGLVQVVNHVRRNIEDAGHFGAVELAGLQKLGVFRRHGNGFVIQIRRQHQGFVFAGLESTDGAVPGSFKSLPAFLLQRVLDRDQTGGPPAAEKEFFAVTLRRQPQADGFGVLLYRADAGAAVTAQSANVDHVFDGHGAGAGLFVHHRIQPAVAVFHQLAGVGLVGYQLAQFAAGAAHDFGVTVSPAQHMALLGLAPLVAGLPVVRLVVQQPIGRVILGGLDFVALLAHHMQR